MDSFKPYLSILPPAQKSIWNELTIVPGNFVLYGGTAIALQLGHRSSIDFDFFSSDSFENDHLCQAMSSLGSFEIIQSRKNTLTLIITAEYEPVKLSFFGGFENGRINPPIVTDDRILRVASLEDLMGHKLKVILQRVEAKDYIDIACLLNSGLSLEKGLSCVLALWPHAPIQEIVRALTYFQEGDFSELNDLHRQTLIKACSSISFQNVVKYPLNSRKLSDY
ncbi:nucleotidyl transferase AbiEii/AbiGii toxin family protein [Desulfonatronovibrio magnus]|uniref:nucleotidyl transferase AbiEii/AbiGii toxin family protein n=1 Tax=Desulfonatronovibrio magnus TaxID=698827 RepID=UPI0005EB6159|nr:nucleotidyl transferase AbiEii/AbiGii toxin family protein [Desulfonatronovibrio magnus]